MPMCPIGGQHHELDSDQAHGTAGQWFVNQEFRSVRVQYAVADPVRLRVNEMDVFTPRLPRNQAILPGVGKERNGDRGQDGPV